MAAKDLRRSPTMSYLLDALERGEDIGHYGRLTFAMAAHRFMEKEELVKLLMKGGDTDEAKARALVEQVAERDYNPPSRQRILEWQSQQSFRICPNADDPNACNPTGSCRCRTRCTRTSRSSGRRRRRLIRPRVSYTRFLAPGNRGHGNEGTKSAFVAVTPVARASQNPVLRVLRVLVLDPSEISRGPAPR